MGGKKVALALLDGLHVSATVHVLSVLCRKLNVKTVENRLVDARIVSKMC